MLMKLLKHEFRATGRIMGPLLLILLLSAVGANLSMRGLTDSEYQILNLLGVLLMVAFSLAIVAVCVASVVLMVQRFYKNLLQDEGYVMLTLPVSIHQQIWTKLIVSAIWFAVTILAVCLAVCVAAFDITFIADLLEGLGDLFREVLHLRPVDFTNITIILVELLVLGFLGACSSCLQFYSALAIGHSAAGHKLAWSVAAYMIIQFAMQFLSGILMIFMGELEVWRWIPDSWHLQLGDYGAIHFGLWLMILVIVAYGAVFYAVTAWFMKHRLNLE